MNKNFQNFPKSYAKKAMKVLDSTVGSLNVVRYVSCSFGKRIIMVAKTKIGSPMKLKTNEKLSHFKYF
jgi:hypothetical protein